jgi:hypothetical protein
VWKDIRPGDRMMQKLKPGDLVRLNEFFTKMGLAQYYNSREGDLGVVVGFDIVGSMTGSYHVYVSRTMCTDLLHYSYFDKVE